jgi:RNA polymerase sigma-70 factor (ECF subfamily)
MEFGLSAFGMTCAGPGRTRLLPVKRKNRVAWQNASPRANTTLRGFLYRPSEQEWTCTAETLYSQIRTCTPEWGDAVQEAILKYFQSDNGLDYDPQRGPLPAYLLGVARRIVLDGRKKEKRRAEISGRIASGNAEEIDPRSRYDAALSVDQIKDKLRASDADPELSQAISGIEAFGDEPDENQQIADRFQTTVGRVNNWKKKLRRFGKRYEKPR